MNYINRIVLFFTVVFAVGCSSVKKLQKRPIGLINNVSFVDSKFDNPNASNGFLVRHNDKTYAITAKHILLISKTDNMKFVDFEGDLKQWKMHPKNDSTSYVITERLLNTNRKDSLTWSYLDSNWDTYNDWLVFSIKQNKTNHKPLKFREKKLKNGECLYAIGWSYKDTIGAQRVYEYKFDKTEGDYHRLIQVQGPKSLGGMSGAPIVDKKGKIVGLITSGGEDKKTKKIVLEATSSKNIVQFISQLN